MEIIWLRQRIEHLIALYRERVLGKWFTLAWLLVGLISFAKTEGLSPSQQEKWQFIHVIPPISLAWWVAIAVMILFSWSVEASFRNRRKAQLEIDRLKSRTKILEEIIRPKLKISFAENITGCKKITAMTVVRQASFGKQVSSLRPCTYYRLEVRANCIGAVHKCSARVISMTKNSQLLFDAEKLIMPFSPAHAPDYDAKDVSDKIPEYVDILAITHDDNSVIITTHGYFYPNSINHSAIFLEPADYGFHVVITSADSNPVEHDLLLKWTGNWRTAEMRSA